MIKRGVLSLLLCLLPSMAHAEEPAYGLFFAGFGPYAAYHLERYRKHPGFDSFDVCSTNEGSQAVWPEKAPPMDDMFRCQTVCEDSERGEDCKRWRAKMRKWVDAKKLAVAPAPGPRGETVSITNTERVTTLTVKRDGKTIAQVCQPTSYIDSTPREIKAVAWAADAEAVAVEYGWPAAKKGEHRQLEGRYEQELVVIWYKAPNRADATKANQSGLQSLKAKDYMIAARAFRGAIASDQTWAEPRYNLARVAAANKHPAGVSANLHWLSLSPYPDAKAFIEKAKTDPEFESYRSDIKVRRFLGLEPPISIPK